MILDPPGTLWVRLRGYIDPRKSVTLTVYTRNQMDHNGSIWFRLYTVKSVLCSLKVDLNCCYCTGPHRRLECMRVCARVHFRAFVQNMNKYIFFPSG